jgi:hypothetical protein
MYIIAHKKKYNFILFIIVHYANKTKELIGRIFTNKNMSIIYYINSNIHQSPPTDVFYTVVISFNLRVGITVI